MTAPLPPRRLGVIVPSSNTVVESLMRGLVPLEITLHVARFRVTVISDEPVSRAQFERDAMARATASLADAKVDHVLWAGTASSWLGQDHDRDFIAAVSRDHDLPSSTAVTGLRARLASLKARRIGLVTPYVEELESKIIANFRSEGLDVVAKARLDLTVNTDYALVDAATLTRMVETVAEPRPDAVIILCTNLDGAAVARRLTARLGLPVLDSVVVAFEDAVARLQAASEQQPL